MYLKLFSSCKITLGAKNSIILDVQRDSYVSIPNTLFFVIKNLDSSSIESVRHDVDEEDKEVFDSYIVFLVKNEFGFITDKPNNFIYFDYEKIDIPSNNCIIEFSSSIVDYNTIVSQLETIKVQALHINTYSKIDLTQIEELLNPIFNNTSIKFVSLLLMYNRGIKENDLLKLGYNYPFLSQLFVYSSPFEKSVYGEFLNIHYTLEAQVSIKSCGQIKSDYFSCNDYLYSESHCFNSCLAGKISIDKYGNIKNCPSMTQSFGNIKETNLEEALNHKDFKKYWKLSKDQIEVCKDCEFRYICTDCRAYTELIHLDKEGLDVSKPLKCGYNPYTAEWEEWSTNPIKQNAIRYYGMEGAYD
ncbi:grasp-with-spasm system SPASM domain peptide maturase [Chryseobacterium lactis]|uniref:Grasp-with-spasm system SPASM domain peptide maturase n=1 Tax=Chryseobacterium lactis TaxID=1241981 RepID=A0A3G6RNB4_CHRLC|nr:grasp-with-spasm system SPASM domain peptide maturase [Chryseobacterium lactis]AZA82973.1 grasp-with-spasm system SPASM domain peptide maturase [Chryseobacterium lactis]AZB03356.1 grasp-with-spasm system SPASM domain peptide maturase [Chryseobacterium lactis]PNW12358.1 grasp-with-spasm system SPASM domain peptide maturase [Chryseobacterium lactis]